jgi:hypothetical protein
MARVRSAAAVTNMVNGALGLVGTLVELADVDGGDCQHPLGGMLPEDCVRCQARRGLARIRERASA